MKDKELMLKIHARHLAWLVQHVLMTPDCEETFSHEIDIPKV